MITSYRESQEFLEKYEGALGKGKGRKLYAYKVMMNKVRHIDWSGGQFVDYEIPHAIFNIMYVDVSYLLEMDEV